MNVQANVALMTIRRLDNGSLASIRITDNGPGALDVVEANFGPGCPQPQPIYFNVGLVSGDYVVVDAPPPHLEEAMQVRRLAALWGVQEPG